MCRQLILVAQNDQRQMIFTCEHGTIHLTHQQMTVCMRRDEFMHFAEVLLEKGLYVLNQSRRWHVREVDHELLELWINSAGFRLETGQFFALTDLIRRVWEQFKQETAMHIPSEPRRKPFEPRWSLN
jgi:hypothetical protein